jgi:sarcosine/dimethylglycine N-methyltransferase
MTADPATASVRGKYDSDMFRLLSEVWENHFHMGWFEDAAETLGTAGARATTMMMKACGFRSGARVVEVACGTGMTARALAERFGADVTASNLSTSQVRQGHAHLPPGRGAVRYAVADFHALPFASASFDAWWCQEALLYSTERDRVFTEACRVVRPGGRLLVSDLLVTDAIDPATREALTRAIMAPGFWTAGRYERFFEHRGIEVLARLDGSRHVAATFGCVLDRLRARRDAFAVRLGDAEPVIAAERRLELQLRRAQDGHLGWSWWVLERPY